MKALASTRAFVIAAALGYVSESGAVEVSMSAAIPSQYVTLTNVVVHSGVVSGTVTNHSPKPIKDV